MRIRPRNDLESNILAYYSREEPLRKVLERSQNRLAKGMLSKVSNILTAAGYDGTDPTVLLRQADPSAIREIERIAQGLPDSQRRKVLGKLYGQIGSGSLTVRRAIRDVIEFDQYHASLDLYDKGKRALKPVAEEGMLRGEFMIQKSAGIGWEVETPGIKRVERFLDRQWTQSDATAFLRPMGQVVSDQVAQGLLLGEHPEEISRRIRNVEDISTVRANRMARTTVTAVSNEAHADSMQRHGVKRYEFRAMFNERTCDVCGALDGKVFALEDKRPGTNFPPIHPNCRCTTVAALSKEVKERMRQNAIASGHASPIRERETFEEWKAKNVDPKPVKAPTKPTRRQARAEEMRNRGVYVPPHEVYRGKTDAEVAAMSPQEQRDAIIKMRDRIVEDRPGAEITADYPKGYDTDEKTYLGTVDDMRSEAEGWGADLTEDEETALRKYTGVTYGRINPMCYGSEDKMWADPDGNPLGINDGDRRALLTMDIPAMEDMDRAISKFEVKEPMVVHRGSGNPFGMPPEEAVGKVWESKGYTSTSLSTGVPSSFGRDDKVIMHIMIPKGKGIGAYVEDISAYRSEKEFILKRGSRFAIERVDGNDVYMRLIE